MYNKFKTKGFKTVVNRIFEVSYNDITPKVFPSESYVVV